MTMPAERTNILARNLAYINDPSVRAAAIDAALRDVASAEREHILAMLREPPDAVRVAACRGGMVAALAAFVEIIDREGGDG